MVVSAVMGCHGTVTFRDTCSAHQMTRFGIYSFSGGKIVGLIERNYSFYQTICLWDVTTAGKVMLAITGRSY